MVKLTFRCWSHLLPRIWLLFGFHRLSTIKKLPWNMMTSVGKFVNTLRPRQNCRHFADDIFKCIFLNENIRISINISLKFLLKGQIYYIPALVQMMAWRRPGYKPLSEPIIVSLLAHICVTRPQWVNKRPLNTEGTTCNTKTGIPPKKITNYIIWKTIWSHDPNGAIMESVLYIAML